MPVSVWQVNGIEDCYKRNLTPFAYILFLDSLPAVALLNYRGHEASSGDAVSNSSSRSMQLLQTQNIRKTLSKHTCYQKYISCLTWSHSDNSHNRTRNEGNKLFLDLRFARKHKLQHNEMLRGTQPVEDPTAGPPPSEKHYKSAVLTIARLQMISRDTPFLRCQADHQSVLLDTDFEYKDCYLLGLASPVLGEVVGTKKQDSPVRGENRELEQLKKLCLGIFGLT